ncbi:MAG: aminotransferase class V-fold PLP-dependent enzyme, partial [Frisingicoccus sp.]|uniref:cysteine desulfurase family protein n=1 Tax=Frisingicoccus sp. TaxID=1918627 RepID=UPI0026167776
MEINLGHSAVTKEIYLDNAATTKVLPSVCEYMVKVMSDDFGNPSSLHMKGFTAEQYIKEAKKSIASVLKVDAKEIVFTSGGTESNNMAIIGGAMANQRRGRHLITTSIEHASVYNPFIWLEEQGFEMTYLPVDDQGTVSLEALKKALRDDTILVSVMAVNNEIGTIQPLDKIGQMIKEK